MRGLGLSWIKLLVPFWEKGKEDLRHKDTEGRRYMRTEEIGVMLLQTREHPKPPEAGRRPDSSEPLEGRSPMNTWFQTCDLQNWENKFLLYWTDGNLLQHSWEPNIGGKEINKEELQMIKNSLLFYVIYKMRGNEQSLWFPLAPVFMGL